jgi:glycosyltransferase involved in cell wall biosynthesis
MQSAVFNSRKLQSCWHILDVGSIWMKEFAAALGTMVETHNWCPEMRNFGHWEHWQKPDEILDPAVKMVRFPLQRGYARFPIAQFLPSESSIISHLLRRSSNTEEPTLMLTSPFYAPVAEHWPGRIVYYLTDLTKEYAGMNPRQVVSLDRRMCAEADLVCPNSRRIADYLCREASCDPKKIAVIPNATRASNVLSKPLLKPIEAPIDLADLPRPIVGVIGNLAGNLDWRLLADAVARSRDVSWAFVGPTDMEIPDPAHRKLRSELMRKGGRVRFAGPKPYSQLAHYAQSFDVALIPYLKKEPTISGSATRFYEHLAACRPILASRAHAELLTKEPLLKLVSNGEELAWHLDFLRAHGFSDGYEEIRWKTSKNETWHARAAAMLAAAELRGFRLPESQAATLNQIA